MLTIILVSLFIYLICSIALQVGVIFMNKRTLQQIHLDWVKNPDIMENCDTKTVEAVVRASFLDGMQAAHYFLEPINSLEVGAYRSFLYPERTCYRIQLFQQAYAYNWERILELYTPNKTFVMIWGAWGITIMRVK
jgi:hypothetical protein